MNGSNKPPLSSTQAFVLGAVGGVAPVLVRGAVYLFSHDGQMPPLANGQVVGYFFALVIFLIFGGVIAIALDDARTIKSTFLIGVSLPSLFQVSGLQADTKKTADISRPFHVEFIASAQAGQQEGAAISGSAVQNVSEDALASRRKLEVSTPNADISKNVAATFLDNSGNRISSTVVQPGFAAVNVPAQATKVQFEKDGSTSDAHPLTNNPVQTAEVKIEQKPVSAFVQAIGLSREAKTSIDVAKLADAQKLPVSTNGWCYLGDRSGDGWRTRYIDFPGQGIPQKGDIVTVNFPLNVRPSMGSDAIVGVAHVGQRLRIDDIKNQENLYWAAVSVVE